MSSGPLLYYFISNDRGESAAAPNCARLPAACASRAVQLADVLAAFPLAGSGSFHFRFQLPPDASGSRCYLDLLHPTDAVPTVAGTVVAKVLRLDTLASQARPGLALPPLRPLAGRQLGAAVTGGGASSYARSPAAAASAPPSAPPSAPFAPPPPAFAMPVMKAGQALHVVPKEEDGETHIRDDGRGTDIYSGLKREDANGMRPVKAVAHDEGPVEVPDDVDEDLADKSDLVKAKVMARRAELRRAQAERQQELDAAASTEAREAEDKDSARREFEGRVNAWALEPMGGKPRDIRVLLTTLHTVLWDGSGWEPLGLDKVVVPARVRVHFMKACTRVHPDKQSAMSAGQRYVATQVFATLTTAFREFEEREMR